jgi:hypothetical protein
MVSGSRWIFTARLNCEEMSMNESMKAVREICSTIMKKLDRAYVLESTKKWMWWSGP